MESIPEREIKSKAVKKPRPGVGTGIFLINKGMFLVCFNSLLHVEDETVLLWERRKRPYKYGLIGGHVERFETFQETAAHETFEEAGLSLPPERFHEVAFLNVIDKENDFHYVEVMLAVILSSEEAAKIYNKSPKEHVEVKWIKWDDFKELVDKKDEELFLSMHLLFQKHPEYKDIGKFKAFDTVANQCEI